MFGDSRVDHGIEGCFIRHVDADRHGSRANALSGRHRDLEADVGDHDAGTFSAECRSRGESQPAGAAGDENGLSGKRSDPMRLLPGRAKAKGCGLWQKFRIGVLDILDPRTRKLRLPKLQQGKAYELGFGFQELEY